MANLFALLDGEETEDIQQIVAHVKAKASSTAAKPEKSNNQIAQDSHSVRGQRWMNGTDGRGQRRQQSGYNRPVFNNSNNKYYSQINNRYNNTNGNSVEDLPEKYNANHQQNYKPYPRRIRDGNFRNAQAVQVDNETKAKMEEKAASGIGVNVEVLKKEETVEDKAEEERRAKQKAREEEWEAERKLMTLKQYEEHVAAMRKPLVEAMKSDVRKVDLDKDFQSMELKVRGRDDEDDKYLLKQNCQKHKPKVKEEKVKTARRVMSFDEFKKLAQEEERKREEIRRAEEQRRGQQFWNKQGYNRPRRSFSVENNSDTGNGNQVVGKKSHVDEFPVVGKY